MCQIRQVRICILTVLMLGQAVWAQSGPNLVCVAGLANSSGQPVLVDQLKEELVAALGKDGEQAISAPTITMLADRIDLSASNRKAMKACKCRYVLLTEVVRQQGSSPGGASSVSFALFEKNDTKAKISGSVPITPGSDGSQGAAEALHIVAAKVSKEISPETH